MLFLSVDCYFFPSCVLNKPANKEKMGYMQYLDWPFFGHFCPQKIGARVVVSVNQPLENQLKNKFYSPVIKL
jgi:hypothetical protein